MLVENDPEIWYRTLKRLVEDMGLCRRLGVNDRRELVERYTLAVHARRGLEVYREVLDGGRSAVRGGASLERAPGPSSTDPQS